MENKEDTNSKGKITTPEELYQRIARDVQLIHPTEGKKTKILPGDEKNTLAETLGIKPHGKKDEKSEKPYGRII